MPSPIAHSVSGYVISKLWSQKGNFKFFRTTRNYPWLLYVVFVSNAPDLDFILQLFSDEKIHRGFTHSVTATLGVSLFAGLVSFIFWKSRWKQLFLITLLLYGFHLCLDAFTGGSGMKLLWPFIENYYRFPFSLFPPVHHSRGLLDFSHVIFVSYELAYSVLLFWGVRKWQFFQKRGRKSVFK